MDEEIMKAIGKLEDEGVIEWHGMEDDDAVFAVDMDKLRDVHPELYESIIRDMMHRMDGSIMNLYEKGLLDITYDENLDAMIQITDKGMRVAKALEFLDQGEENYLDDPRNSEEL